MTGILSSVHRRSYQFIHDNPGIGVLDWADLHFTVSNQNWLTIIKIMRGVGVVRVEGRLDDPASVSLWPLAKLV